MDKIEKHTLLEEKKKKGKVDTRKIKYYTKKMPTQTYFKWRTVFKPLSFLTSNRLTELKGMKKKKKQYELKGRIKKEEKK